MLRLLPLLLSLLLLSCRLLPIGEPPRTGLSTAEIESFARIKLCAAATDVQSYTEKGIDRITLVKFAVPPAALDGCIRDAGYTEPLKEFKLQFGELSKSPTLPAWWNPASAQNPLAAEKMEAGFFRKAMVDRADPARFSVYLSHSEF